MPADLTGEGRPYCGLSCQNVAIIMKPEAAPVAEPRRRVIVDPLPQLHVASEFGAREQAGPCRAAAAIASARRGPAVVHRGEPAHDLPALGCPLNRSSSCHTWWPG